MIQPQWSDNERVKLVLQNVEDTKCKHWKGKNMPGHPEPKSLMSTSLEKLWLPLLSSHLKGNLGFDLTLMVNIMWNLWTGAQRHSINSGRANLSQHDAPIMNKIHDLVSLGTSCHKINWAQIPKSLLINRGLQVTICSSYPLEKNIKKQKGIPRLDSEKKEKAPTDMESM